MGTTLSSLVANFTAWAIIGSIGSHNAHAILRSSIGLSASELPARLVISSIYLFVCWVLIFMGILLPNVFGLIVALIPVVLIGYIVVIYSSLGRLIIYSKAMRQQSIFVESEEHTMTPRRLFEELVKKAEKEKERSAPLPLYYRSKYELSRQITGLREQAQDSDLGFDTLHANGYLDKILEKSTHRTSGVDLETDLEEGLTQTEEFSQDCPRTNSQGAHCSPRERATSGRIIFQDSQNTQNAAIAINMG